MRATRLRAAALAGAALFLVGACSSSGTASTAPSTAPTEVASVAPSEAPSAAESTAPSAAAIVVPEAIKTAGKLVWCVDVSYPPEEFYAADGTTAQGSDVDIANEIGKRFGRHDRDRQHRLRRDHPGTQGRQVRPDHQRHERHARASQAGRLRRLPEGRPGAARCRPATPRASRRSRTCPARRSPSSWARRNKDTLDAANVALVAAGKPPMEIQTFDLDTDAFQQLALGRVDAFSTDSPVVAYYNSLPENAGKFEVGGTPIEPIPIGIAVRKVGHGVEGRRAGGDRCDVCRRHDARRSSTRGA